MSKLEAARLRDALKRAHCTIGNQVVVLPETTSTNDKVLELAEAGTAEGLVVFAEHQTAGRGQRGNRWESAAGKGLWLSILLRPKIDIRESARLTSWAAETVARTIQEEFGLAATVKPPNDVQVEGRKIAGVLVEMRAQNNAPHIAITGIGINVKHAPEDFSAELRPHATSVAMALDRAVDREQFAIALLQQLDRTYYATFGL